MLQSMGSQRVRHDLTEQQWQLISHLWGDIFILCKHLLPHQISPTCFGIHWWFSNFIIQSISSELWCWTAGSQSEELHLWQRSWERRLGICKGRIEPQESPWKFSSIYPQNQTLPNLLLCALTYTSDFTGGCPPPPLSEKELTYSSS